MTHPRRRARLSTGRRARASWGPEKSCGGVCAIPATGRRSRPSAPWRRRRRRAAVPRTLGGGCGGEALLELPLVDGEFGAGAQQPRTRSFPDAPDGHDAYLPDARRARTPPLPASLRSSEESGAVPRLTPWFPHAARSGALAAVGADRSGRRVPPRAVTADPPPEQGGHPQRCRPGVAPGSVRIGRQWQVSPRPGHGPAPGRDRGGGDGRNASGGPAGTRTSPSRGRGPARPGRHRGPPG